ncbi:MAG: 2Fe-2S iron-sulfur cluster-binding protein [Geminicoccaceae bacterium]
MISRLRITTGLILFFFVFFHLVNLSFGLVSLQAMEEARPVLMGLWSNPLGGAVLLLCLLIHCGLGLWSLFRRTSFRLTAGDLVQALLGIAIIPLLLPHLMATAVGPVISGVQPTFSWILAVYWFYSPELGLQQVLALMVIWIHACYGLFLWVQVQDWWGRFGSLVYPLALVVPVAALLGMVEAGKELYERRDDPVLLQAVEQTSTIYDGVADSLWTAHDTLLILYALLLAGLILARLIVAARGRRKVSVSYDGNPPLSTGSGPNLLELARADGILHASICGGRGRCGSCAVRVLSGAEHLGAIDDTERATLARISAGSDIRLACQAVPKTGAVAVERIFPSHISPADFRELRDTGRPVEVAATIDERGAAEAGT